MTAARVHPFDVIVRVLSERLQGRAASIDLRAMLRSQRIDWDRVVGYASDQFVLPAFGAALKDLGLVRSLEEELGAFLEAIHAANLERNRELRAELAAAVRVLNRIGIEPVLLKGSIRLVDGLYPDDGWRMLRDLDLLVPAERRSDAVRAFEKTGYAVCEWDNALRCPGKMQIDLHEELFSAPRQVRALPAADMWLGSRVLAFSDGRVRIPSVEHQLMHLVGHSQVRDHGYACGRISLRDRLEAAALLHWGGESIDWDAVAARFTAAGYRRPLLALLLSLSDGDLYAVPVTGRIDVLSALQQRRIALQARSAPLARAGLWAGCSVSEIRRQVEERDAGQRRVVKNLKRLIFERAAIARMVRAVADRQRSIMHFFPHFGWFLAQSGSGM